MKMFLLRRLYGAAQIVDGFVNLFTPFSTGLPLRAAKAVAREHGRRRS